MTAKITLERGRIIVSSSFDYKETCSSIPGGRWEPVSMRWTYPASPWVARTAIETVQARAKEVAKGEVSIAPEIAILASKAMSAADLIELLESREIRKPEGSKFVPWRHQFVASSLIRDLGSCYLAHEMGCGKTKSTIDAILRIHNERSHAGATRVLIACPASVVDVWRREIEKHVEDPSVFVVSAVGGKKSVKDRAISAARAIALATKTGKIALVVANYESFVLDSSPMLNMATEVDWDLVVADEAHRLATPGSKTSLAFSNKIGPKSHRRVALSGTPFRNSPLDIYAQCRFLDPGVFGTSSKKFEEKFAVLDFWGAVVGTQNEEELAARFALLAHRVDKRKVLKDLPPVMITNRRFELSKSAQEVYNEFEKELAYQFEKGEATASNSLVKLLRLAQMTSGYLPITSEDNGADRCERIDGGKAGELAEYLSEISPKEPVVVFCRFRHDLDEVAARTTDAGRVCYELSGRINSLREWQEATGGEVLAVQIQAGGIGVDLTRACYGVFYSIGYGLSEYEQAKARLDRPGQTRPVTLTHLIATGTVDETVFGSLSRKANAVEDVIDRIRKAKGTSK